MRRLLEAAELLVLVALLAVVVAIGWTRDLEDLQREGR
jgi:hypothetical protein